MSDDEFEEIVQRYEKHIKTLCKSVNAPQHIGRISVIPLNVIQVSGEDMYARARRHPWEPIIMGGQYYFAYIRDNAYNGTRPECLREVDAHPNKCYVRGNKVHFYYCNTLQNMGRQDRTHRYHTNTYINETLPIDLRNTIEPANVRLAWCKNCIVHLARKGQLNWNLYLRVKAPGNYKNRVAEYAISDTIMRCVKACHEPAPDAKTLTHTFFENLRR